MSCLFLQIFIVNFSILFVVNVCFFVQFLELLGGAELTVFKQVKKKLILWFLFQIRITFIKKIQVDAFVARCYGFAFGKEQNQTHF